MRSRYWALLILAVSFGASSLLAPAAQARTKSKPKPKPITLLADRSCTGLLGPGDFPGAVSFQGPGGIKSAEDDYSTCLYLPPEPPEGEPPIEGGGGDTLHVFSKFAYQHTERGTKGYMLNLVPPPAGSGVPYYLHGVGTRAYFITAANGGGYGALQVRNDVFTVTRDTSAGIAALLKGVAHTLCPGC